MQPNYTPQEPVFELDWSDRKAIQRLYGKLGLGWIHLRALRRLKPAGSTQFTWRLVPKQHRLHEDLPSNPICRLLK